MYESYTLNEEIIGESAKKDFICLFGAILRMRNILTAFDDFAGNEILSAIEFQNYQSIYLDLRQEFVSNQDADKENINNDIEFEVELVKQIEVNIDYILMLVIKYHESNCTDKSVLVAIDKAVGASIELRSKKELIQGFVERVNANSRIDDDWVEFVREQKETDLSALIETENLKFEETRRLIDNAFRDGILKTTGTDIDKILPPISRFSTDNNREEKKQNIIDKLMAFFDKYLGIQVD